MDRGCWTITHLGDSFQQDGVGHGWIDIDFTLCLTYWHIGIMGIMGIMGKTKREVDREIREML